MSNETWLMGVVHDSCVTSTKIKVLTVVDDFTQSSVWGYSQSIRVDYGSEFTGKHFQQWAEQRGFILITLKPESRWIRVLSKVSTTSFGMNASISVSLPIFNMHRKLSRTDELNTMGFGTQYSRQQNTV